MSKPKIICDTSVRNRHWIIEKFLRTASVWARPRSNHRAYQPIERIRYTERGAVETCRIYHHMGEPLDRKRGRSCDPVSPIGFIGCEEHGIDLTSIEVNRNSCFERKAHGILARRGANSLRRRISGMCNGWAPPSVVATAIPSVLWGRARIATESRLAALGTARTRPLTRDTGRLPVRSIF